MAAGLVDLYSLYIVAAGIIDFFRHNRKVLAVILEDNYYTIRLLGVF